MTTPTRATTLNVCKAAIVLLVLSVLGFYVYSAVSCKRRGGTPLWNAFGLSVCAANIERAEDG